ncbi:MAG TPA: Rossmann-like and DUF2520 domain-containing protein [Acidimicrobiales bacterium]|nr:Rossmann-like and DUF2520 domain-containing protein [Acidimicrobiales bacterium]
MTAVRMIGPGRAGRSFAAALEKVGVEVAGILGRDDDARWAAQGVDAIIISTSDTEIAGVAASVVPSPTTVVMHLSGALGLDVLQPHLRRGSLHPLAPLPDEHIGVIRLLSGITFAVDGDPMATHLATLLGGKPVAVDDAKRDAYHAAACIASNHVVALLGQVERIAAQSGLDLDMFLGLTACALADVTSMGPSAALTGPAARADLATLQRHREAMAEDEIEAYDACVALARRLVEEPVPCV